MRLPLTVRSSLCVVVASIAIAVVYDFATKRIPTRLSSDQAPKSHFGLLPVETFSSQANSEGIDVIFVHGLGSNPDTTWHTVKAPADSESAPENIHTSWISDFLSEDIPSELKSKTRFFFYNYDSYWKRDAIHTRLPNLGENLLYHIRTKLRASEEGKTRKLVFVCHSYGGLVTKQALAGARGDRIYEDVVEQTRAILFLGTPHRGSTFSTLGRILAGVLRPLGSNPSLFGEIGYDSTSLHDLHRAFVRACGKDTLVFNFFEERPTRILKAWFVQWRDFYVREESATYDAERVQNVGLSVDHFGLNKFASRDGNYGAILQALLAVLQPRSRYKAQFRSSIPFGTVDTYVERPELSSLIHEKLSVPHTIGKTPFSLLLHGLGGTGKTQLALNYIEKYSEFYNIIMWIDAQDEEAVLSSFERCVLDFEIDIPLVRSHTDARTEMPPTIRTEFQQWKARPQLQTSPAIRAVLKWLEQQDASNKKWLVVFDNADDLTWGIRDLIPHGSNGSILITSRDEYSIGLVGRGEKLRVDIMQESEAKLLLLQHLQIDAKSTSQRVADSCDLIARELGYLALAIDLAGSYIKNAPQRETALTRYPLDLKKHKTKLLQSKEFVGLRPTDKTVWTVWETTLAKIKHNDQEAQVRPDLLLRFLSTFRRNTIEDELFRLVHHNTIYSKPPQDLELPQWLDRLIGKEQEWDDFDYRAALRPLVRYGLVQTTKGPWPGVTLHSLVKWRAVQEGLEGDWESWLRSFLILACDDETRYQKSITQLFRHVLVSHVSSLDWQDLDDTTLGDPTKILAWKYVANLYYEHAKWIDPSMSSTRSAEGLHAASMAVPRVAKRQRASNMASTGAAKHRHALEIASTLAKKHLRHAGTEAIPYDLCKCNANKLRSRGLSDGPPGGQCYNLEEGTHNAEGDSMQLTLRYFREAEILYQRMVEVGRRVLDPESQHILIVLLRLTAMYFHRGREERAMMRNNLCGAAAVALQPYLPTLEKASFGVQSTRKQERNFSIDVNYTVNLLNVSQEGRV